jgi:hypothetical protein
MRLCDDYGPFDFRSVSVRDTWGAWLPFSFFLALCLFSIPVPSFLRKAYAIVKAPFQEYITLHEDAEVEVEEGELAEESVPLWHTLVCVSVGITEAFCWIAHRSFILYKDPQNDVLPFLIALVWLYTVIRPIARPMATPPYDLFTIYFLLFGSSILQIGGLLPQTSLQSSECYISHSSCLSQFLATS